MINCGNCEHWLRPAHETGETEGICRHTSMKIYNQPDSIHIEKTPMAATDGHHCPTHKKTKEKKIV